MKEVRVGEPREWRVKLAEVEHSDNVEGRVIITRYPAPIAKRNEERVRRQASRKQRVIKPETILASHYFVVFTTIPAESLATTSVLELYRFRWQIEIAFKRLKQVLKIGRLPHKDPRAARAWIHAKLVVALILEKIYRQARSFSPWGYDLHELRH